MEIDMTKQLKPDFIIIAGEWATMWGFQPASKAGWDAIEEIGVEDWQWTGGAFFVDHRPARDLARFLNGEGLTLYHPEYGYFGG